MYEAILQLILKSDGKHTWYTLDRALSGKFDVSAQLISTLKQLVIDGLVEPRGNTTIPSYWITEKGRIHAESALRATLA